MLSEGEVLHLDSESFDRVVGASRVPVLVDFWAQWCMPCLSMGPVVERIAREFKGRLVVGKVNVDECPDLAQRVEALSIPLFVIYKDGREVDRVVGAIGMALAERVKRFL